MITTESESEFEILGLIRRRDRDARQDPQPVPHIHLEEDS